MSKAVAAVALASLALAVGCDKRPKSDWETVQANDWELVKVVDDFDRTTTGDVRVVGTADYEGLDLEYCYLLLEQNTVSMACKTKSLIDYRGDEAVASVRIGDCDTEAYTVTRPNDNPRVVRFPASFLERMYRPSDTCRGDILISFPFPGYYDGRRTVLRYPPLEKLHAKLLEADFVDA